MQITRFKPSSGRGLLLLLLAIAMLVAAPLTVGAQDSSIYVSVRVYDGVDPADQQEIARLTDQGFLPIMRESQGFVGYYLLPADDRLASVSMFDTAEQAAASNEKARAFVAENLAPLLPNPPIIAEGTVDVMHLVDIDRMMDDASALYASLRIYHVGTMQDIEESNRLVKAHLLPALQANGGLFSYYSLSDGLDTVVGLNVYTSEENALTANDIAAAFVAEYMMDWQPEIPVRISGQLGIAALAGLHMGENLIDDMMDDGKVFASIRLYEGLDPNDMDELFRLTADEILEILQQSDGFIGYYWLHSGETVLAINLFATEAQASASNDVARAHVAERLAGLAPNPPLIVDGPVHIGVVDMLDAMEDSDITGLHANLRIYNGFETDNLGAFVRTVEDGFLPLMQETDGFFGYYLMDDGAGTLAAVSIFDTEASAAISSEKARDFVADYLTAFLPNAPSVTSGQLDIAALAAVNDGANLIDNLMDQQQVFVSIRLYDGVDPADQQEIARITGQGFLPILRESDGFVGYYLLPSGDKLASVTMFESAEQAAASNDKARDFVVARLAPLLPNPPQIVEGLVELMYVADEMMMDEGMASPHALLAIYDGFDMTHLDETVTLVESIFLPDLRENGGLVSYFGFSDGVDKAIALRIADSADSLQQGSDIAADFVAEYLADWLPVNPTTVSGQLGVAAMADMHMGANLVEYSRDEASVFASVRVYEGVDPATQDTIARVTNEGFLPIMRASEGFVGYFLLSAGDTLVALSLFDSAEQASASNEAARGFVAENLAPLLPHAPMITEGTLSINHVAALGATDDYGRPNELYASIRFYEGFDLRHFDDANDLAISHLLPALQDLGGLFAQFAFNDGEDTVVGISIFEDQEATFAANNAGKAFTQEYLAEWAPNPPTGVAGEIAVAALAEMQMGKNLIADGYEDEVFVSIRVYDGVDPADQDAILRITSEGFLPIMRQSAGFVGYYLLPAGDTLASVSLFDSPEQASASNAAARDFVTENLTPLLPNRPQITEGMLDVMYVTDEMMDEGLASLYAALRVYENYDLTDRDVAVELVATGFVPLLQGADGFFSYFSMDDGVDRVVTLSVYETEENALAANELAAAFVAEYMTGWIREEPRRINGRLGLTALADKHMGANLLDGETIGEA